MLDSLDKGMIHENIIPAVYQIRSREPGVLMAILGGYGLSNNTGICYFLLIYRDYS